MWQAKTLIMSMLVAASASAQQLSDPTEPPRVVEQGTKVAPQTSLRLESIKWTENLRVARINGQRLQEGDTYNNYKIQSIGMDQVTLLNTRTNEQVTLAMFAKVKRLSEPEGNRS